MFLLQHPGGTPEPHLSLGRVLHNEPPSLGYDADTEAVYVVAGASAGIGKSLAEREMADTAREILAKGKARKPYDLFLFPDERHMPRALADRVYMEERIRDYFVEHL